MPKHLAAKPKSQAVSRTMLDQKLAELYSVSPRTVRLWRRKGAPLDEPGEMTDWIADLRRQGKGDGAEVRVARLQKLTLQIEALTLREREEARGYLTRAQFIRLYAPMAEHLRETVRELLLTTQPPALVNKTEADVRVLVRGHFDAFLTNMREWCQADRPRRAEESAAAAIQRLPATPVDEIAPRAAETPKSKRGRVADPEMEALRLQKLTLECAVLERANHVARGDLLPLQEALNTFQEHIGRFRHDLRNCLLNEQPATMTGRSEADIRQLNQKTFQAFNRRLRTGLDALDAFMLPATATA